ILVCRVSQHIFHLPGTQPHPDGSAVQNRPVLRVPAGASVPSTTGSYFCRQELSAAGRVSAPAFYVLSAGSLFY
uniref:Uncharacterized protein n=1 Tax=Urocitellus parryii TaxID=9999 RepID=A0A8D2KMV9_UROPR